MDSKNKLTVSDIPQEMLGTMRQQFDSDPRIRQMLTKQNIAMRDRRIIEALSIGKAVNELWERCVQAYVDQANEDADNINLKDIGLPEDDLNSISTLTITLFMCCDIIDSVIMDINDIIHRKDKTLQFEMFDEVDDMAKMVKGKLSVLQKETSFLNSSKWGDIVDNMYDMMQSKARKIINLKANGKWKEY